MNLQFHYGARTPIIVKTDNGLQVSVMNPPMNQCGDSQIENWRLPTGQYARRGDFHLITSDAYILGAASIKICPDTLASTTESLYDQLLTAHPECSLYRIWHFVPQINDIPNGRIENYRAFCQGRALAFETNVSEALHSKIPAASAVGTTGEHLTLVYLAGKARSTHIENPRQTPAYKYPVEYGPKAPAFARATTVNLDGEPVLFISGTASILASESIGDSIERQLATTIENLKIVAANTPTPCNNKRRVRVYLRDASDLEFVQQQLKANYLQPGDETYYIAADICRKELLVEIEVTIGL